MNEAQAEKHDYSLMVHGKPVFIVIPVYNGEKYIAECIQSCLDQTYPNVSIYIIDNCSTDETGAICLDYENRYEGVHYLRFDEFESIGVNWNRAISLVSDRDCYVKLLCADDVIFPECVSQSVQILENNKNITIVTSYEKYFGCVSGLRGKESFPLSGLVNARKARDSLIKKGNWIGNPSGALIKYNGLFNPDLVWMIDVEYWMRLLTVGDLYVIEKPLYGTRRHEQQLSENRNKNNEFLKEELREVYKYCTNKDVYLETGLFSCLERISKVIIQIAANKLRSLV